MYTYIAAKLIPLYTLEHQAAAHQAAKLILLYTCYYRILLCFYIYVSAYTAYTSYYYICVYTHVYRCAAARAAGSRVSSR
jgi:hypothetical protein